LEHPKDRHPPNFSDGAYPNSEKNPKMDKLIAANLLSVWYI
jgi:hypothetical protein